MPSSTLPWSVLAALAVAAALLGAAGPADGGTHEVAADRALNTSTATPTPTQTPYCDGPGCTETPTSTPYCTGPGCSGTPTETYVERPACEANPDAACTASPTATGDWHGLLRALGAFLAPMMLGLVAVGIVLARWRFGPD